MSVNNVSSADANREAGQHGFLAGMTYAEAQRLGSDAAAGWLASAHQCGFTLREYAPMLQNVKYIRNALYFAHEVLSTLQPLRLSESNSYKWREAERGVEKSFDYCEPTSLSNLKRRL